MLHRSLALRSRRAIALSALALVASFATGCHEIFTVLPSPAAPGDQVIITGSGFGADQAASEVIYDGQSLAVQQWGPTEIIATLPDPKPNGTYTVQVRVHGQLSNALAHEIITESHEVLVPDGAIVFQEGTQCAPGYEPLVDAEGRFLVGRTDGTEVGVTVGTPLAAGEDRTHSHSFSASVNVGSAGLLGLSSCCTDVGDSGSRPVNQPASTAASHAGPPRLYQLVCERVVEDPEPPSDDHAFPNGAVVLFNKQGCPDDFELLAAADGRMLVPTPDGGIVGDTIGAPLASGEDRTHSHGFSSSIEVSERSLAAAGGSNTRASKGTKNFSGTTDASTSGVPYVQLLACRALDRPAPPPEEPITGDLLPAGTFSFFDEEACPEGWTRSGLHQGRLLTGMLPASGGGIPYETRGGGPLVSGEDRAHAHAFSGSVTIPNRDVALAAGCCNSSFGANGTYNFSGTTSPAGIGLPYLSLLGCEKDL